jgi:type 2 lantibiotic biosynthesis protein LanM
VLGATDFHLENIIAAGDQPMLVDLETLFHGWEVEAPPHSAGVIMRDAVKLMARSVLSVGLLPTPHLWTGDDGVNMFDASGMAGAGGQLTAAPVATFEEAGTDEMRLVRKRVLVPGSENLPSREGTAPVVLSFRDELVEGFRSMYRTLRDNRDALLHPAGPLMAFATDEVRIVVRPTQVYMTVLDEGRHPDLLRDGLDRDRFFANMWAGHETRNHRDRLIAAELDQLYGGDIPVFVTTPSSTSLIGGDGTVLADMVERSGLTIARQQLSDLSDEHLALQTWIIEASLTAMIMGDPSRWERTHPPARRVATTPAAASGHLAAARRVGDRLLQTAITADERICWLGLNLVGEKAWSLSPAGMDLYNGIGGIGLYLGYLARLTGDRTYRLAAEQAADMAGRQVDAWLATPALRESADLGAFGRIGGSMYALSHLAAVLARDDLADTAMRLVPALSENIDGDRELDVIGGSAGGILALLALHAVRADPVLLDVAGAMARHLVDAAEETGDGLAWRSRFNPSAPLAGFSHGASGIATALARLDRATGSRTHRATVLAALRFERSLFDPETGNWRDVRSDVETSGDMVAWCHGAAGVAIARADLLDYLDHPDDVRAELLRAVSTVWDTGLGSLHNHSICHGDLGNLEAMMVVAERLGDHRLARRTAVAAAGILADIGEGGVRCGVPLGVETPGLMSGLSGIGLALLRLCDPVAVPSALLVQPPRH